MVPFQTIYDHDVQADSLRYNDVNFLDNCSALHAPRVLVHPAGAPEQTECR